jgi:hypothetical protein
MELLFALGAAMILLVIVWKVLKGIARTAGLVVIAGVIAYFVISNGGFS